MIKASGLSYDPTTRDWTKLVEYSAQERMEAIRWCTFNRNWLKSLTIQDETT